MEISVIAGDAGDEIRSSFSFLILMIFSVAAFKLLQNLILPLLPSSFHRLW